MRRVSVVGVSGAGKTTVGRRLADRLDVPFVELDAIDHVLAVLLATRAIIGAPK